MAQNRCVKIVDMKNPNRLSKYFPVNIYLRKIKDRCIDSSNFYKKRGIKCFLTVEELNQLWHRDKAYLMEKPSVHRIASKGNYTLNNCKFMEWEEHRKFHIRGSSIIQYNMSGKKIKEFYSILDASKKTGVYYSGISDVVNKRKHCFTAGGFIWKKAIKEEK